MTKPPYAPLTMAAVRAAPLNGLTHVSTFSGAGGTCLGFRLAGFRTLLANDIDAHACRMYARNLVSPIDARDIRTLTAPMLLERVHLKAGDLDVFEGSPPCTAFSTAGKLAQGWGQMTDHAGHVQANIEDLFFDWLRLLEGLQPRAFVAENVAGLVKGVAKGYFKEILQHMKRLGYRTEARLLDAQWLGVPQRRARVIFIGLRADLETDPIFPAPLPYRYSVRDALPWLTAARYDTQGQYRGKPEFIDEPCPTIIGAGHQAGRNAIHYLVQDGRRKQTDDVDLGDTVIGRQWDVLQVGERAAGARDLIRIDPELPSPPILAVGGHRGTNAVLHPHERRKFTIDELKRICSFPIDFNLSGPYEKQWARLGNSVPPLMAYAIGVAVRDVLLKVDRARA